MNGFQFSGQNLVTASVSSPTPSSNLQLSATSGTILLGESTGSVTVGRPAATSSSSGSTRFVGQTAMSGSPGGDLYLDAGSSPGSTALEGEVLIGTVNGRQVRVSSHAHVHL